LRPRFWRARESSRTPTRPLRDAGVREQISALDCDIRGGTAREFAAFVSLDISRYKRLAEDMGLAEE